MNPADRKPPAKDGLDAVYARIDALEVEFARRLEERIVDLVKRHPALLGDPAGGALPRLELPADALPPTVAPGVASEPLHGALSLVEGSRVAVLMELGGVWLGTVLRRTAAGVEVDLGRAGTMVVPADRVSPVPEAWR